MVAWARKYGIQSTIHTGGPSIPGSGLIDADVVLEADADVIGHINGGHTALPLSQIRCLCEQCARAIEIVHNGNALAALYAMRTAIELGQPERIMLGTDSPAGSGVQPLGILRTIAMLSSLGEIDAATAFCFATGNTARLRELDCGLIEPGRAADLVIMDRAQHTAGKDLLESVRMGDLPGDQHGDHRRRGALRALAQHAARHHAGGGRQRLTRGPAARPAGPRGPRASGCRSGRGLGRRQAQEGAKRLTDAVAADRRHLDQIISSFARPVVGHAVRRRPGGHWGRRSGDGRTAPA